MEIDHVALDIMENDLELDATDGRQVREQGAFSHDDAAGDSQAHDDRQGLEAHQKYQNTAGERKQEHGKAAAANYDSSGQDLPP